MNDQGRWRRRAQSALQAYFRERSWPRLAVTFIVILTGLAGFLISVALLHGGLVQMWIRYPIAVILAYAIFLGLIRIWVEVERVRFNPENANLPGMQGDEPGLEGEFRVRSGRGSSWLDWLDIPNALDFGEGCLPALVILAVIGLLSIVLMTIINAPGLIAEVFLDAFVVSALYRRLRIAAQEHWLGTAIKKTWLSVVGIAVLLSLVGLGLETLAPNSRSIGPAVEKLLKP